MEIAVKAMTKQMEDLKNSPTQMSETSGSDNNVGGKDAVYRQDAIEAVKHAWAKDLEPSQYIESLPSAQPTLYGYNVEHLILIASVLQKENLTPERVVEALTDIGRVVAIVRDEFFDNLRKAVENVGFDKQTGSD